MIFRDRGHAGRLLAERLGEYRAPATVVLALPRGGVPVGRAIADALQAPLDVMVARKIGMPGNEELAVGAVTARGVLVLNQAILRQILLPPGYLEAETERQRHVAHDRQTRLRGLRAGVPLAGKTAILVDDGIATGMTMMAAIADIHTQSPRELVVAVPVAPIETARRLREQVDHVVVLQTPEPFFAVGQFYEDFTQVDDDEVQAMLAGKATGMRR